LKTLGCQDLHDLVDGAAIFSAGGGGSPEGGHGLVDRLMSDGCKVRLVSPSEFPLNERAVNFACVGATTTLEYDSEAAVKTLKALEEYAGFSAYATVAVELGGFNTLAAVDVGARRGIPVVDADGAGRSVPEVHLKVYTIDGIPLAPMAVADSQARNMVIVRETADLHAAERIARVLAAEWNHCAYTARRILTGAQVRTSPVQLSLSKSMNVGKLLRQSEKPIEAVLKETGGLRLFEGSVKEVDQKTEGGFTFVTIKLHGKHKHAGSTLELKAKNEILVAYKEGKLAAIAPDIITPVDPKTGKCITAEKISEDTELAVLGLPAPEKWKTKKGLELWKDVLVRTGISEEYTPIEKLKD
jgi:DUF917 family protein